MVNGMWSRLRENLNDPVFRGKALALMGGKAIGADPWSCPRCGVFIAPAVYAADGPTPEINALNTMLGAAGGLSSSSACRSAS
jgi:hypothetical protein